MIYLRLFWEFIKIGLFSFGGAYAAIPLIKDVIIKTGWMSEESFLNLLAVSESTPGPIMVNSATCIGYSVGGFVGAVLATLGVVLPAFAVIIIVSTLLSKWIKSKPVQKVLKGINPCVIGVIFAVGICMLYSEVFKSFTDDKISIGILFFLILLVILYKRFFKKDISPIFLISISAVLGIVFY